VASEAEVRFWLNVFLGGIATRVSGLVWVGAAATIVAGAAALGAAALGAAALGAAAFLAAFFAFFAMVDLVVMMKVRKMRNHDLDRRELASCMEIIRQVWPERNFKICCQM
jgi:hypothetical protein